jgi:hypothetical protein
MLPVFYGKRRRGGNGKGTGRIGRERGRKSRRDIGRDDGERRMGWQKGRVGERGGGERLRNDEE